MTLILVSEPRRSQELPAICNNAPERRSSERPANKGNGAEPSPPSLRNYCRRRHMQIRSLPCSPPRWRLWCGRYNLIGSCVMQLRFFVCLCAWLCIGYAGEKKPPVGEAGNDNIDISARPILDKEEIQKLLGADLGGTIVVLEVTVKPKTEKPLAVSLDDFMLISHKDGQKSQPFEPSQIAGSGTLMVHRTSEGRGGSGWGIGGFGIGMGTGGAPQTKTTISQANADGNKDNKALLETLKEKILPEKQTADPVSGLLYFPIDGKLKPKDLEFYYRGPAGQLSMIFK